MPFANVNQITNQCIGWHYVSIFRETRSSGSETFFRSYDSLYTVPWYICSVLPPEPHPVVGSQIQNVYLKLHVVRYRKHSVKSRKRPTHIVSRDSDDKARRVANMWRLLHQARAPLFALWLDWHRPHLPFSFPSLSFYISKYFTHSISPPSEKRNGNNRFNTLRLTPHLFLHGTSTFFFRTP
jgi:hypothetical protein